MSLLAVLDGHRVQVSTTNTNSIVSVCECGWISKVHLSVGGLDAATAAALAEHGRHRSECRMAA